jgi:hypothetical protein
MPALGGCRNPSLRSKVGQKTLNFFFSNIFRMLLPVKKINVFKYPVTISLFGFIRIILDP